MLLTSRGKTMTEVAEEAGVTHPNFRRILTMSTSCIRHTSRGKHGSIPARAERLENPYITRR
jgi:hypothetical protein